ncbi:MAG: hypothetical protein B1H13_05835 [Desulfobacteraceae bacterium 4484_190.3]|nr:MAG: hypothetical protein B1H13_05835 [Desulfobacteraceae bacterium 4484_190.3]
MKKKLDRTEIVADCNVKIWKRTLLEKIMRNLVQNIIVIISATGILLPLLLLVVVRLKGPGLIMT